MRAVGSYKSTHFIIPHSSPSSYRIRSITIFSTHQQFSHFSHLSQPRSARENRKAKVGHQAGVRCQRHCDFSQMNQNSPPSPPVNNRFETKCRDRACPIRPPNSQISRFSHFSHASPPSHPSHLTHLERLEHLEHLEPLTDN